VNILVIEVFWLLRLNVKYFKFWHHHQLWKLDASTISFFCLRKNEICILIPVSQSLIIIYFSYSVDLITLSKENHILSVILRSACIVAFVFICGRVLYLTCITLVASSLCIIDICNFLSYNNVVMLQLA
jgi:hypothetical protein